MKKNTEENDSEYNELEESEANEYEDDEEAAVKDDTQVFNNSKTLETFEKTNSSVSKLGSLARKRKHAQKKTSFDIDDDDGNDDDNDVPTHTRLTERGGYAHTQASRLKISLANRGTAPWNKGKTRSSSTKARIAAGVRARNRAKLLTKLQELNMTEQEYEAAQTKLKYIRERVRRTKLVSHGDDKSKKKMSSTMCLVAESVHSCSESDEEDCITTTTHEGTAEKKHESFAETALPHLPDNETSSNEGDQNIAATLISNVSTSDVTAFSEDRVRGRQATVKQVTNSIETKIETKNNTHRTLLDQVFVRDVTWTPHVHDTRLYNTLCPQGGIGGLICCQVCADNYLNFLSSTCHDFENQKVYKMKTELNECTEVLLKTKATLSQSVREARRKPPPTKFTLASSFLRSKPVSKNKTQSSQKLDDSSTHVKDFDNIKNQATAPTARLSHVVDEHCVDYEETNPLWTAAIANASTTQAFGERAEI